MKKKIIAGLIAIVAIVAVAIFAGCIGEEKEKAPVVTPTPSPTPTPTPPINYDSSEIEKIRVEVDSSVFCPEVTLYFYDKYGRRITKFNNGETNIIVALESYGKEPTQTKSTLVAAGQEMPKSIWISADDKLTRDYCEYIGVVILLPDGRIANTTVDFDYDKEIDAYLYESGYSKGRSDAYRGYSPAIPGLGGYYSKGYLDGYYGFTPRMYSVSKHETISLSPPISEQPKSWHPVTTFSGKAKSSYLEEDKITTSFTIQGEVWRVTYTVSDADPKTGGFSTSVYPRGETVRSVASVGCRDTPCNGTTYVFKRTGDYYFKVSALDLDSWKLEVEDYY